MRESKKNFVETILRLQAERKRQAIRDYLSPVGLAYRANNVKTYEGYKARRKLQGSGKYVK